MCDVSMVALSSADAAQANVAAHTQCVSVAVTLTDAEGVPELHPNGLLCRPALTQIFGHYSLQGGGG